MQIKCDSQSEIRIDKYLKNRGLNGLYSRSRIEKLFKDNSVLLNGKPIKKSVIVKLGDVIDISLPQPKKLEIVPQNIPLDIVYEDEYLIIINKQAGLIVHPGAGANDGTLVNALVYHYGKDLSSGSDKLRPGIVHRLDKDTTGLLVVARNDKVHYQLSQKFQKREIIKKYKAISVGVPPEQEGKIHTCLARSTTNRKKMSVSDTGREALSVYKVLENFDYFSLLEIDLKTGRTHQIRVHLESIGCPVLGDQLYTSPRRTINSVPVHYRKRMEFVLSRYMKRQALHSCYLSFIHPVTNQEMHFEIDLPEDMQKSLEYIKKMMEI